MGVLAVPDMRRVRNGKRDVRSEKWKGRGRIYRKNVKAAEEGISAGGISDRAYGAEGVMWRWRG